MASPKYTDLSDDPPGSSLVKQDAEAVLGALDNLFSTDRDEVPFFLDFTADLGSLLFRDLSDETAIGVYTVVAGAMEAFEPRARLDESRSSVTVNEEEDGYDMVLALSIEGIDVEEQTYRAFLARQT